MPTVPQVTLVSSQTQHNVKKLTRKPWSKEVLSRMRNNPKTYVCSRCSAEFLAFPIGRHWRCRKCALQGYAAQREARAWVTRAVKLGRLLPATSHRCVDCGAWATCWEHRNYDKPLNVEPTCDSCNHKRGPASFADRPTPLPRPYTPVVGCVSRSAELLARGSLWISSI